ERQISGGRGHESGRRQGTRSPRTSLAGDSNRPSATNACATPTNVSARAPVHSMLTPAGHHAGYSTSRESLALSAPNERRKVGTRAAFSRSVSGLPVTRTGSVPGVQVLAIERSVGRQGPKVNPKHSSGAATADRLCAPAGDAAPTEATVAAIA